MENVDPEEWNVQRNVGVMSNRNRMIECDKIRLLLSYILSAYNSTIRLS